MKFTNKDAKIRLYDGTGTPFYLELCLDNGDLTGPMGDPVKEEILVLDRGLVGDCSHYITSNDMPVMEPVDISFSVIVNDAPKFGYLLDWLEGNTVNSNTIVTTKGDNPRLGTGMVFADTTKKTADVEYLAVGTIGNFGMRYNACYFDLATLSITEAEDGVNLSVTGKCYETIERISAFTAGTDVTA